MFVSHQFLIPPTLPLLIVHFIPPEKHIEREFLNGFILNLIRFII